MQASYIGLIFTLDQTNLLRLIYSLTSSQAYVYLIK